jgi:glycogen debranching enzyme
MTIPSALHKITSALDPTSKKIQLPEKEAIQSPSKSQRTPKTPQDEAIAYFSSADGGAKETIQVWELWLEDDGGPAASKSVRLIDSCAYEVILQRGKNCR